MVDKSNTNFVTINFNYVFHIEFKYLFYLLRIRVSKFIDVIFKKKFSEKKYISRLKHNQLFLKQVLFYYFYFISKHFYSL